MNAVRRVVALMFALAVLMGVAVAPASASPVTVLVTKACATAPNPAKPDAGLAGMLYPRPTTARDGDPFADPSIAISDVYGYGYGWATYDTGCLPTSSVAPGMATQIGNAVLSGASAVDAGAHSALGFVVAPTWLAPMDEAVTLATKTIADSWFTPGLMLVLILVGVGVLVAASRANVAKIVTNVGWAVLLLVVLTFVVQYPVTSVKALDGVIQESVTASAQSTGVHADGPSAALTAQFDTVDRMNLYAPWLEGTLGSSTSKVARDYGPDLFKASHLSWNEAALADSDPGAYKDVLEAKGDLWTSTAAKVQEGDPGAYDHLTGNAGRWSVMFLLVLQIVITMPFLLVAGVMVVMGYLALRIFIPLLPALGLLGMLEMTRDWFMGVVQHTGRFLLRGPLYWLGALIDLSLTSAALRAPLPYGIKLLIAVAIPFVLFKLLKPGQGGMGALKRMGRMLTNAALTRRAVGGGVSDAIDEAVDEDPKVSGDGPVKSVSSRTAVADGPVTSPARSVPVAVPVPRASDSASRDARHSAPAAHVPVTARTPGRGYDDAPAVDVETDPRAWQPVHSTRRPHMASAPEVVDVGEVVPEISPRAGRDVDTMPDRVWAAPLPVSLPVRQIGERPVPEVPTTPSSDVDLSAPVSVLPSWQKTPASVYQAPTYYDDGGEVFELWRPAARDVDAPLSAPVAPRSA